MTPTAIIGDAIMLPAVVLILALEWRKRRRSGGLRRHGAGWRTMAPSSRPTVGEVGWLAALFSFALFAVLTTGGAR